jgi:hypothetical protein
MSEQRPSQPMTMALRVDRVTPAHVTFAVFIGRGFRGKAGDLTMRLDEFAWYVGLLGPGLTITGDAAWMLPEGILV